MKKIEFEWQWSFYETRAPMHLPNEEIISEQQKGVHTCFIGEGHIQKWIGVLLSTTSVIATPGGLHKFKRCMHVLSGMGRVMEPGNEVHDS